MACYSFMSALPSLLPVPVLTSATAKSGSSLLNVADLKQEKQDQLHKDKCQESLCCRRLLLVGLRGALPDRHDRQHTPSAQQALCAAGKGCVSPHLPVTASLSPFSVQWLSVLGLESHKQFCSFLLLWLGCISGTNTPGRSHVLCRSTWAP